MIGGAGLAVAMLSVPSLAAQARARSASLAWQGRATVHDSRGAIDLVVRTELELPVLSVRASSYIAAQGPGTTRTLLIEPDGAWLERGGSRQPLPVQQAVHERQQFALYAYVWLVQLGEAPAAGTLDLAEPPFPPARLTIGGEGLPSAAALTVEAPEPGRPPIAETARFADYTPPGRDGRGLRWPQRIELDQDGRRAFTLLIDRFAAR